VNFIVPEGSTIPRAEQASANFRFVAPEFARTLGIRLLRGRWVRDNERDVTRPAAALISESTAVRMWPGQDPIGKRFSRGIAGEQAFEVVGVLVRRAIREIDPEVAVGEARPLKRLVESSLAVRRHRSQLFLVFGAMALFIATVGVYAVTSYGISRRRREMNIRAALGAQPRQVVAMILRQSGRPVAIGLAAGALGAVGIGRLVSSLLFGISARDPYVLVGTVGLVGATGFLAAAVAARRGLSLDPAAALRDQ
jgi:putative ABC transport system permease protein